MRLAAISIDLDEVDCYSAIHGLPEASGDAAHAVYRAGLPRFLELFEELSVPATFFAIGRDLSRPDNAAAAARLVAAGHEVGNHSLNHRYNLTRQPAAVMRAEVAGGIAAVEAATGVKPVGFRAPGYTVSDGLFEALAELSVLYDSSVFPCPAYYAAKLAAIGGITLRGRASRSVVDRPIVLAAPGDPYRVGVPYVRRGAGVLELPIGVTRAPSGRLPYIGTSLILAGPEVGAWLTRRIAGRPLVNLELHGIDLCDAELDGLQFLRPHQPDLRKPLAHKLAVLRRVIEELRGLGYELVTLADAARRFAAT